MAGVVGEPGAVGMGSAAMGAGAVIGGAADATAAEASCGAGDGWGDAGTPCGGMTSFGATATNVGPDGTWVADAATTLGWR